MRENRIAFAIGFFWLLQGLAASPAWGEDRVLRRVPHAEKALRKVSARQRAALHKAQPHCQAKLIKQRSPESYLCQIQLLVQRADGIHFAADRPLAANKSLRQRLKAVLAAYYLAQALGDYKPVNPAPGLDKQRFEAQARACESLGRLYDQLSGLPVDAAASQLLKPNPGYPQPLQTKTFKALSCACSAEAEHLAQAAFVSPDDPLHASAKRSQYSRGCFLDVKAGSSSLVNLQRSKPGGGPRLATGPLASDRGSEIIRIATSRAFQFEHCKHRLAQRRTRKVDLPKLESCVCEVAQRWRFARTDNEASVEVDVPLVAEQFLYHLTVGADGKVSACAVAEIKKP